MKVSRFFLFMAAVSLIIFSTHADAELIYVTGDNGTALYTIDTADGSGTFIGDTGTVDTYATAFSPDGTLYTVTNVREDSGDNSYLGTFNLITGEVTLIGGGGGPMPPTGDPLGVGWMTSLEFAPDGTLYGGSFGGPYGNPNDDFLYTIDTSSGVATQVDTANLGFDGVMDFAFDITGILYAVGDSVNSNSGLYTVDTTTGEGSFVTDITGVDVVMSITFGSDGTLYAADTFDPVSPLYTVDTGTGATTFVGNSGIDFAHGGDILVPEPISSTLFLIGGATLGFRRWRKWVS